MTVGGRLANLGMFALGGIKRLWGARSRGFRALGVISDTCKRFAVSQHGEVQHATSEVPACRAHAPTHRASRL